MMFVTHDICGAVSLAVSVVAIRRGYRGPLLFGEWEGERSQPRDA